MLIVLVQGCEKVYYCMVMYNRPLDTVCVVAVCVLYVANRHTEVDATGLTRDISHRALAARTQIGRRGRSCREVILRAV